MPRVGKGAHSPSPEIAEGERLTIPGVWGHILRSGLVRLMILLLLVMGLAIAAINIQNAYGDVWGAVVGIFFAPILVATYLRRMYGLGARKFADVTRLVQAQHHPRRECSEPPGGGASSDDGRL